MSKDEKIEIKDFQVSPVEVEYKGKKLVYHPLSFEDALDFLDVFLSGDPKDLISTKRKEFISYVAKSLKVEPSALKDVSPGFLIFSIDRVLEAIDFNFFVLGSRSLQDKIVNLTKALGLETSSVNLSDTQDGELNMSSKS